MAATRLPAAVAALVAATMMAGCAGPEGEPYDVVVDSTVPTEVRSEPPEGEPLAIEPPTGTGKGHLAGVVVDPAVRPIKGAVVRLPSLDMQQVTDRDGSFGFVDLAEGSYFIEVTATGYRKASSMLLVKAGEFTRAKVVLGAIPPPEPYHVVLEFEGYTELSTNSLVTGQTGCAACEFTFGIEPEGLRALILEATFDAPEMGNQRGFYARLHGGNTVLCVGCSGEPDPMRIELRDDDIPEASAFRLEAVPQTFPGYETAVHFHVYATAFYHELAPTGWSFVAGDR